MRVFRIEREKYLNDTLKGIGAAMSEGFRWNSPSTYLVYTSECRALATLEISVHLDFSEDLPTDRFYVEIDIPDDIEIMELKVEDLPNNWASKPPSLVTQCIGDDFVKNGEVAVLRVPSSIIPPECNYLINPHHLEAKRIKIVSIKNLSLDERFKK